MSILLDTQAFLWLITDAPELSKKAKQSYLDSKNELFLSLASVWELAIKVSIGKLVLQQPLERLIPEQLQINDIKQLDINFRHVMKVVSLPFYHRDPFDRILAAQALEEKYSIMSSDKLFDAYKVKRIW